MYRHRMLWRAVRGAVQGVISGMFIFTDRTGQATVASPEDTLEDTALPVSSVAAPQGSKGGSTAVAGREETTPAVTPQHINQEDEKLSIWNGHDVDDFYVTSFLDEGGNGAVFGAVTCTNSEQGRRHSHDSHVAIKCSMNKNNLLMEYTLLGRLNGRRCARPFTLVPRPISNGMMPQCKYKRLYRRFAPQQQSKDEPMGPDSAMCQGLVEGKQDRCECGTVYIIVEEMLGESLDAMNGRLAGVRGIRFPADVAEDGGLLSVGEWLFFCEGMLNAVYGLHERSVVHGDIKLANFCLGASGYASGQVVKLIDMGFAADAMDIYAYHARRRPRFAGTADYASRSMLHCKPTTFYDDLESLLYCFLELYLGDLPWRFGKMTETNGDYSKGPKKSGAPAATPQPSQAPAAAKIENADLLMTTVSTDGNQTPPDDLYSGPVQQEANMEQPGRFAKTNNLPSRCNLHVTEKPDSGLENMACGCSSGGAPSTPNDLAEGNQKAPTTECSAEADGDEIHPRRDTQPDDLQPRVDGDYAKHTKFFQQRQTRFNTFCEHGVVPPFLQRLLGEVRRGQENEQDNLSCKLMCKFPGEEIYQRICQALQLAAHKWSMTGFEAIHLPLSQSSPEQECFNNTQQDHLEGLLCNQIFLETPPQSQELVDMDQADCEPHSPAKLMSSTFPHRDKAAALNQALWAKASEAKFARLRPTDDEDLLEPRAFKVARFPAFEAEELDDYLLTRSEL